ncbi:MAG TPA: hypothetical protein VN598_00325 [Usitatibacter sp.]|nr:hypothetical protein [Usitatibacter sp.]
MKKSLTAISIIAASFVGIAAAQTTGSEVQRNVNQQDRIEQGLKSGQLSTGEAAKLEKGEARVQKMEANANKDGTLTGAEKARIQKAQNAESRAIDRDKHNAVAGNPNSASSQRMQADVQRNANQQKRIEQGVQSGSLTGHETAKLERGEARTARAEARAGANGRVGPREQKAIQSRENRESKRIHRQKHDAQTS